MAYFDYKAGILCAENLPIPEIIAASQTPVYIYSTAALKSALEDYQCAFADMAHIVCYAVKANSNVAILRLLGALGAGMDVVSHGEYMRARAAGIASEKIVFSGVGKTETEIHATLKGGIRQFNVESESEFETIDKIAAHLGKKAPISFRINPDIDANTHDKITTGRKQDKFGIPFARAQDIYARARRCDNLEIVGIDMHIGSQLNELTPYRQAYRKMAALVGVLRAEGHTITRLDVGGGLGITYRDDDASAKVPSPSDFSAVVREELGGLGCEIEIEPGRSIAGNAGIMVSKVIYTKVGDGRDFLILDGAMNDLIRPALYDAHHEIIPVKQSFGAHPKTSYDIVGPVCETSDTFARARPMPTLSAGDLVAFRSAGAYAATMASEYNTRPLISEILVEGSRFATIRARATIDEIIARDIIPDWLA